jgi:hypothetical protein
VDSYEGKTPSITDKEARQLNALDGVDRRGVLVGQELV